MPHCRCLDLTRLISRVGQGQWTGIDRVELAYLRALVGGETPLFVFVSTWLGYLILDHEGARAVLDRLEGARILGQGRHVRASAEEGASQEEARRG